MLGLAFAVNGNLNTCLKIPDHYTLDEVKLTLVGDGGSGKTSLLKRLLGENFEHTEAQTHGINIKNWQITGSNKTIKVHFWDFGGQEIMHATHQFFLSKRSLYILVLDGRKEEKLEYWLRLIESLGGNSPILVVLNKMDQNPGFDVNRVFLQQKYQGIKGFFRISCATKKGIDNFIESLKETVISMKHLQTLWPINWFNVKTELENTKNSFLTYEEYRDICNQQFVDEKDSQNALVDFLNDLGVIVHFKDFKLADTYILEPKWITNAVYKIINSRQLAENYGLLKLCFLDEILGENSEKESCYPRDKYRYIIELMRKFKLCYEINTEIILIPDLLEVQEPKIDFDYPASLKFIFEYEFLPRSVIPQFIVTLHRDIKEDLHWRTGVVLEDKESNAIAVIKSDEETRRICIWVNGEQKRTYFAIIRKVFQNIHDTFEKLSVTEQVPLPDYEQITIEYQELVGLERMKEEYVVIGKLGKRYKVKQLLDGIEKEEERFKRYANANEQVSLYINELTNNTQLMFKGGETTMGNKYVGRDNVEISGNARVDQFITGEGDSLQGDYAKKLMQTTDQQSSQEDIARLLAFVQQELRKLPLPEEVKEEVANEVKGAEIQVKKEIPHKEKVAGKLKNATEALAESAKTVKEAVMIGNLLGKAISWCGERWVEWMI